MAALSVGVPAHAAAPPQFCSSGDEQNQSTNAARCHAQRAASAAFRAHEAFDYVMAQKANWTTSGPGDLSGVLGDADAGLNYATKYAKSNDADKAAQGYFTTAHAAAVIARETATALGACQRGICVGAHGMARDAADDAETAAKHLDNNLPNPSLSIVNKCDENETAAITAYRNAGWIVD
ncbi:hypothetical protein ACFWF7_27895 [Nocardia sp. NPDC060256]|uniref:hypothetical protein n=1 Tax=unclassified Nocardia TaxID=2637762 RepID=UPI003655936B